MSIGGTIKRLQNEYFFYCKECKTDHVFEYGKNPIMTPCKKRFIGISKHSKAKTIHSRVILSNECLHVDSFGECGMIGSFKDWIFCPKCGKKIKRISDIED